LGEVGDKIDASEKAGVEADLQAVKDILEKTKDQEMSDSQIDELKAAKEKLTNSAQSLFTKMYENMQQAQQGSPDMGAAGAQESADAGAADDVVDGDYREI
jgi:molecular chaperone DnaK